MISRIHAVYLRCLAQVSSWLQAGAKFSAPFLSAALVFLKKPLGMFLVILGVAGFFGLSLLGWMRRDVGTPVTRGYQLAVKMGCFACHGPNGMEGANNPGSDLGFVPPFRAGGAVTYYVQDEKEIREWILYGMPKRLAEEAKSNAERKGARNVRTGVIKMPGFAKYLSSSEVDDLAAYFKWESSLVRSTTNAVEEGRRMAEAAGCFGCHGKDGRGKISNPGSFKGYIPPWDSDDFEELVENENELRSWISNGMIRRFERNPPAAFFFNRMPIKMPAYKDVLGSNEFEGISTYIAWLRDKKKAEKIDFVEHTTPAKLTRVEQGKLLYQRYGCVSCHGPEGKGGIPNRNYVSKDVPNLSFIAESMELFIQEDAQTLVGLFEKGVDLSTLTKRTSPIPNFDFVYNQYSALKKMILQGGYSTRRDVDGPRPPMNMPAWEHRMHADRKPINEKEVDAIIAYLLSLQEW